VSSWSSKARRSNQPYSASTSKPALSISRLHASGETQCSVNDAAMSSRRTESVIVRVPVGSLEDARLTLEPAAVRLLDVVAAEREDVEDETTAGNEQRVGRAEGGELVVFRAHVQERAEGADDETHSLRDGWFAQVAETKVEPRLGSLFLGVGPCPYPAPV
jgi:hypothetical protein